MHVSETIAKLSTLSIVMLLSNDLLKAHILLHHCGHCLSFQGTCEVEITVTDVNDNPPVFINAPYIGEVLEHAAAGQVVFVVGQLTEVSGVMLLHSEIKSYFISKS